MGKESLAYGILSGKGKRGSLCKEMVMGLESYISREPASK